MPTWPLHHILCIDIFHSVLYDHIEPTITTPNGEISETLMSGTLRDHYMEEHREY